MSSVCGEIRNSDSMSRVEWQCGLAVYLAKTMKGASKELAAKLELAGHPNMFPSTPVATTAEWDLLHTLDYRTLLCCNVQRCNAAAWNSAISAIYDEVDDIGSLLGNLREVPRTVSPSKDATVLFMPSQAAIRTFLMDSPEATAQELMAHTAQTQRMYTKFFIEQNYGPPIPGGTEYDLDEALGLYESVHVLEGLSKRWSPVHLFKCNCPEFFKSALCVHSRLAGMACDSKIKVPASSLGITIQSRRKRGRPSTKGSELGDAGEARARARLALQSEYRVPKVSLYMFAAFS